MNAQISDRPSPLWLVCAATFLGSVSGGTFWSAIFFVASRLYGVAPVENLTLAAMMGLGYACCAWLAGPLVRRSSTRLSPRSIMMVALFAWGLLSLLPLAQPSGRPLFWVCALLGTATSAVLWPIMESFMSSGRHGAKMRAAIGWFNVSWTTGVTLPLLLMPLLASVHVLAPIASCAGFNLLALLAVARLPRSPGHHDPALSSQAVGPTYRGLRDATLWLLPLSYVMAAVLSPLLPSRLHEIGSSPRAAPLWASTWLITRAVALTWLGRTSFWGGRWAPLATGVGLLLLGVLFVLLSHRLAPFVLGLALFGAGMATLYNAALYYGLAVGHAEVEAGGTFEGLVGLGYFIGPALGLLGFAIGGARHAGRVTLLFAWVAAAFALVGPLRAFMRARATSAKLGQSSE